MEIWTPPSRKKIHKWFTKRLVHGTKMLNSETQIYLGDLLTTSGKINENIISRYNEIIGKVIGILQEVSFGQQYFKMALLFCSSFLLGSMLCSSKVLYEITNAHIEKREPVDRICFRKLLHALIVTLHKFLPNYLHTTWHQACPSHNVESFCVLCEDEQHHTL